MLTRFTHTPTGQLQSEDGPWSDDTLTLSYTEGLRTALGVGSSWSQNYGYDAAWRMTSLASPAGSFDYGYPSPVSPLVSRITLPNGSWITNDFDSLARLRDTSLKNRWGHTLDGTTYTHDPLGLRTNLLRDLGGTRSTVSLTNDPIAQLTTWSARETNGTPRLNEQNGWGYDAANNLHYRTNGALIQTFTTDHANQLSTIVRTGPLTVTGNTPAPATNVTVNGQPAARYGDFTFASASGFTLNDGANSFTNLAQNVYGLKATNIANVNLPVTVTFTNDLNGNLISDGLRWFEYDADNQLTAVTISNAWRTEFVYDGLRRRRIIKEHAWSSGWTVTNTVRQVFDGLVPIQERDGNNAVRVTYTRGLDLSGSIAGAGGIGGLLARTDASGSAFYHSDGIGNVTAILDGNGDVVARYLYNPFGKLVGKWGTLADANVMRFSSMPFHDKSGLSIYYARAYDVNLQRWLNEDPSGEESGINLHSFVFNDPINLVDDWGMQATMANPAGQAMVAEVEAVAANGGYNLTAQATRQAVARAFAEHAAAQEARALAIGAGLAAGASVVSLPNGDLYSPPLPNYGYHLKEGEYVDHLGNIRDANGDIVRDKLGKPCPKKKYPKLGYEGTKPHKDALKKIQRGSLEEGDYVDLGFIPTKEQAMQLLEDAGIDLNKIRTELGHLPPNPHNAPHINYPTPSVVSCKSV